MNPGVFVVSLDFELHWGVHDKRTVDQYRGNLAGAWEAVPRLLGLFREYRIHATWATVGMLFFQSHSELVAAAPSAFPIYSDSNPSPYRLLDAVGPDECADSFHLAPTLIRQILATPGQEIGSHTFSHYYCLEDGATREAFVADIKAARYAAASFGVQLASIIFPRTQIKDEYLPDLGKLGFICFRGSEPGWMNHPAAKKGQTLFRRAFRLADTYIPLVRTTSFDLKLDRKEGLANIPASRFLRPWSSPLRILEGLKRSRIQREMTAAARLGRGYHLWWHPENFGLNLARNLDNARAILSHFALLRDRYGFQSLGMAELSRRDVE